MRPVRVYSRAPDGLESPEVCIEVFAGPGLPGLSLVGLAETAVKESRDRVRAAILNSGFEMPDRRIVVNLAPADLPKSGSRYDLAIALGILGASRQLPRRALDRAEFIGELSLTGELRAVAGTLPVAMAARAAGRVVVVPADCRNEAGLLDDDAVLTAANLESVVDHLRGERPLLPARRAVGPGKASADSATPSVDMADVRGQRAARRALEIAAVGRHHLLMSGPPGTGKSMLAQRLPGLLPPPERQEALEIAAVHSLRADAICPWGARPFRAPHHSASAIALAGGGGRPRPGEISLAHGGVLFLDELPEFGRHALEMLREPLETGQVTVARAGCTRHYPARFQLVAAMNPCPCGFAGDSRRACRCSPDQARRYRDRLSGPLLDRLDILIQVTREPVSLVDEAPPGEDTATIASRVAAAASAAARRGHGPNASLHSSALRHHARPEPEGLTLLEAAAARFNLSHRACDRVLRVARSIADLADSSTVMAPHVAEALSLRSDALLNGSGQLG